MTWTMFLVAFVVSVLGRIFAEDAKSLIPRFCRTLLRRAARRIDGKYSDGLYEEWLAHLDETPELTLKLWHALSIFVWGAGQIGHEVGFSDKALHRHDKVKRAFDLSCILLGAPAYLAFVSVAVVASFVAGCKPFVSKEMVGKDGRAIRVWKIGTVRRISSSEIGILERTNIKWRVDYGSAHRIHDSSAYYVIPRGVRFIRWIGLDWLPILWSVFRGDISLVGPRMLTTDRMTIDGLDEYPRAKPGISGLSQLRAASGAAPSELTKLDQVYCHRRSLVFDLKIIWMTTMDVFTRH